jgi:hypothetical protein
LMTTPPLRASSFCDCVDDSSKALIALSRADSF